MLIGGLQRTTLIDYPSKVAATIFTIGCNFNCSFCHNPELVDSQKIKKQPIIQENIFFDFLKSRKGLLDGVCITGGEPTIQADLIEFIKKIKQDNFLVKLDTNGSKPKILKKLLQENLVDYIAMDIKSSLSKYSRMAGKQIDIKNIQQSVNLIQQSKIDYEFRTTIVPNFIDEKEIQKIGKWLNNSKTYILQQFVPQKTLDTSLQEAIPYQDDKLERMVKIAKPYFNIVKLRN